MPVQVEQRLGRNIKTSTLYTKEELDLIFGGNIAAAGEAVGRQSELDSRLTTLNEVDLPALQADLDQLETDLTDLNNELDGLFPVTETNIADDAISTPKLQANSVIGDKILANTITANKLAVGTITANEIASNTITANEIAADTITANELNVATLSAITTDTGTLTVSNWIRSSNYSAGSAGFSINSAGDAEFNNIDVRGGSISEIIIENDYMNLGNVVYIGNDLNATVATKAGKILIGNYNDGSANLVRAYGDTGASFVQMIGRTASSDAFFLLQVDGDEIMSASGNGVFIGGTLTMDSNGVITNTAGDYTITESGFFVKTNSSYISERAYNIGDDVGLYGAFWGSSTEVILEAFASQNRPLKLNANANELRTRFGSDDVDYQSASSTGSSGSTRSGWIRIEINGTTRFIRTYSEP